MLEQTKNGQWTHILELLFIYYIGVQAILDVTAFFQWPVSQYIRILALLFGLLYLFIQRYSKLVIKARWYVIGLFVYMAIHIAITLVVKTPLNFADEVSYMIKTVYFPILLLTYFIIFKSKSHQRNWDKRIWSLVVLNMGVIATVMLMSTITDTGRRTYGALAKAGHSGWFFSGNELSAIVAMGFPIVLMYVLLETTGWIRRVTMILAGLLSWVMLMIGTKVAFGSVVLSLAVALILLLICKNKVKQRLQNLVFVITLLLFVLIMIPLTPIGNNLDFFLGEQQETDVEKDLSDPETVNPSLLSGRKGFLTDRLYQYLDATTVQKIFGLGYAGLYESEPKLTEMDLFDWGFAYGLPGLFLLLLPLLYGVSHIVKTQWQTYFKTFGLKKAFISLSVVLGLGTGIVAGHVLASPSASIYLCIVLAALFTLNQHSPTRFNEKRMYDATKVGNNISDKYDVSKS